MKKATILVVIAMMMLVVAPFTAPDAANAAVVSDEFNQCWSAEAIQIGENFATFKIEFKTECLGKNAVVPMYILLRKYPDNIFIENVGRFNILDYRLVQLGIITADQSSFTETIVDLDPCHTYVWKAFFGNADVASNVCYGGLNTLFPEGEEPNKSQKLDFRGHVAEETDYPTFCLNLDILGCEGQEVTVKVFAYQENKPDNTIRVIPSEFTMADVGQQKVYFDTMGQGTYIVNVEASAGGKRVMRRGRFTVGIVTEP